MALTSVQAVKSALTAELGHGTAFSFVNTRLILRTGVDLNRTSDREIDDERLRTVIVALGEMGYLKGFSDV